MAMVTSSNSYDLYVKFVPANAAPSAPYNAAPSAPYSKYNFDKRYALSTNGVCSGDYKQITTASGCNEAAKRLGLSQTTSKNIAAFWFVNRLRYNPTSFPYGCFMMNEVTKSNDGQLLWFNRISTDDNDNRYPSNSKMTTIDNTAICEQETFKNTCTAPYAVWADHSSDPVHGNACYKTGGPGKGGGDRRCPTGCQMTAQFPYCVSNNADGTDTKGNLLPCRAPKHVVDTQASEDAMAEAEQCFKWQCIGAAEYLEIPEVAKSISDPKWWASKRSMIDTIDNKTFTVLKKTTTSSTTMKNPHGLFGEELVTCACNKCGKYFAKAQPVFSNAVCPLYQGWKKPGCKKDNDAVIGTLFGNPGYTCKWVAGHSSKQCSRRDAPLIRYICPFSCAGNNAHLNSRVDCDVDLTIDQDEISRQAVRNTCQHPVEFCVDPFHTVACPVRCKDYLPFTYGAALRKGGSFSPPYDQDMIDKYWQAACPKAKAGNETNLVIVCDELSTHKPCFEHVYTKGRANVPVRGQNGRLIAEMYREKCHYKTAFASFETNGMHGGVIGFGQETGHGYFASHAALPKAWSVFGGFAGYYTEAEFLIFFRFPWKADEEWAKAVKQDAGASRDVSITIGHSLRAAAKTQGPFNWYLSKHSCSTNPRMQTTTAAGRRQLKKAATANGEEACEDHGYDETTCLSIGSPNCCEWVSEENECYSPIGADECKIPETTNPGGRGPPGPPSDEIDLSSIYGPITGNERDTMNGSPYTYDKSFTEINGPSFFARGFQLAPDAAFGGVTGQNNWNRMGGSVVLVNSDGAIYGCATLTDTTKMAKMDLEMATFCKECQRAPAFLKRIKPWMDSPKWQTDDKQVMSWIDSLKEGPKMMQCFCDKVKAASGHTSLWDSWKIRDDVCQYYATYKTAQAAQMGFATSASPSHKCFTTKCPEATHMLAINTTLAKTDVTNFTIGELLQGSNNKVAYEHVLMHAPHGALKAMSCGCQKCGILWNQPGTSTTLSGTCPIFASIELHFDPKQEGYKPDQNQFFDMMSTMELKSVKDQITALLTKHLVAAGLSSPGLSGLSPLAQVMIVSSYAVSVTFNTEVPQYKMTALRSGLVGKVAFTVHENREFTPSSVEVVSAPYTASPTSSPTTSPTTSPTSSPTTGSPTASPTSLDGPNYTWIIIACVVAGIMLIGGAWYLFSGNHGSDAKP